MPQNGQPSSDGPDDLEAQDIIATNWMKIVGAVFGFMTMAVFLGLGVASAIGLASFDCNTFSFLAAAFAIGAAMSAAFLGGGAAVDGNLGEFGSAHPLRIIVGGGAAMLVIMFTVFMLLRPADCTKREVMQLQFDSIPLGLTPSAGVEMWSKIVPAVDNQYKKMLVLIDSAQDAVWLTFRENGEVVCRFKLRVSQKLKDPDDTAYHYVPIEAGNILKFDYAGSATSRTIEASDCFRRDQLDIVDMMEVGMTDRMVRFGRLDRGLEREDIPNPFEVGWLDRPGASSPPVRRLGLFAAAYAGDANIDYAKLRPSLNSSNDTLRVEARRLLAVNFDDYAQDALRDLFDFEMDAHPNLLSSLLHGVIEGIEARQPSLKPASGRSLQAPLPYIGGQEAYIVRLTGHPHEWVRKQARRLVQRYPVDAFAPYFTAAVRQAVGACAGPAEGWRVYAAAFYEYNRIIQLGLNAQISAAQADGIDAQTNAIKAAAKACTPPEAQVDIAILDYGRALAYGWSEGLDPVRAARASSSFLEWIAGREAQYYKQSHIARMKSNT